MEQSKNYIDDDGLVYSFLQQYFLNWLEALSVIGKMSESIAMINTLETLVNVSKLIIQYRFSHLVDTNIAII